MKVYGQEIDFRITRVDDAQNFKEALEKMKKDETALQKLKNANIVVFLCKYIEMFRNFFINATGQDVLEGCSDAQEAKDAYIAFLKEINKAKAAMGDFTLEDVQ